MTQPTDDRSAADSSGLDGLGGPSRDRYDVVVIGAGSGGLTVAVGAARFGKSVLLVERRWVGGDCTNVGCIPSKSLLHLSGATASPDGRAVLARVRDRRDRLRQRETDEFGGIDGIELCFGSACVVGPGRVRVTPGRVVEGDHVVVATGSRPRRIDLGSTDPDRLITNEELFELEVPPERLTIIGAGPIGLEMAQAFSRLGSVVTVVEQSDQVVPGVLPEIAAVVERHLLELGVRILLNTRAEAALPAIAEADRVLVAVGRRPNADDLGLDEVGVARDREGHVLVDGRGRTSVPGVWAVGDVTDRTGTTHGANAWGRRVIKSIVAPLLPIGDEPAEPRVVFTDPELATIGHQPLRPADDVRRLRIDLADTDRGFTDEVTAGAIVVDVRRLTGTVLGASVVGPRAADLLAVIAFAMHTGTPMHRWYGVVWPYPSHADAIGRLVDAYMSEALGSIPSDSRRWVWGRGRSVGRWLRRSSVSRWFPTSD